eukprot:2986712-Pyramimonas_sp.AAC.1
MRIRPAATPPIISDGGFSKCAICPDLFVNRDKIWRLQRGHIFHAQCWDRVVTPMWIGSWLETWRVPRARPPVLYEFHCALAGDQESFNRLEDILQRANELRDLREELNLVAAMMTSIAAISATTPAGIPASLVNAGIVAEAATLAGAPAIDAPMPL